mmetsp:Transcript_10954/g.30061  ORF Transcript_10954/g.30061 Transcript_10954/m.30061 type:complete len:326 (+) Transcript_10954:60-1037(+)
MLLTNTTNAPQTHHKRSGRGTSTSRPAALRQRFTARARGGGNPLDESVLERLRAAEEEAARLRQQLAQQQGNNTQGESGAPAEVIDGQPRRVDGVEARETLFSAGGEKSSSMSPSAPGWLNEADVQFFLGAAPPNPEMVAAAGGAGEDPQAKEIVQRRLLITALASAAAIGFALVPTEALRPRPSKPLYYYIVPILRIKDLLVDDSPEIIENADWAQLRLLLSRITGTPNKVHENFDNIVALLDSNSNQGRVQQLRTEFEEYIYNMDFNKYYDSMPGTKITGKQNQEFVTFSSQAQKAAVQRLEAILKLLPEKDVQQALEAVKIY